MDRIIQSCIDAGQGYNFDTSKAMDTTYLKYQLFANMHFSGEDFLIMDPLGTGDPAICLPISDVAPDVGFATPVDITELMDKCRGDVNGTGSVMADDGSVINAGWMTFGCPNN